jgi:TPR repeat protein
VTITTAPFVADPSTAKPRLSAADAAAFLARGDALFSAGDIDAARLFYERAAEAGEAEAAIRLGETFDPTFLDHLHFRGIPAMWRQP